MFAPTDSFPGSAPAQLRDAGPRGRHVVAEENHPALPEGSVHFGGEKKRQPSRGWVSTKGKGEGMRIPRTFPSRKFLQKTLVSARFVSGTFKNVEFSKGLWKWKEDKWQSDEKKKGKKVLCSNYPFLTTKVAETTNL